MPGARRTDGIVAPRGQRGDAHQRPEISRIGSTSSAAEFRKPRKTGGIPYIAGKLL